MALLLRHEGPPLLRQLARVWRWAEPLRTLAGVALLSPVSLAFPPKSRKAWLREAGEMLGSRADQGWGYWRVFGSVLGAWPTELSQSWMDWLRGPSPVLAREDGEEGERRSGPREEPARGLRRRLRRYWSEHRTEILWALVFAVLLAVVAAVGVELWVAYLHHTGREPFWDTWFPAH